MDKKEKLGMLRQLTEKELTRRFLIPLYESKGMGCKNLRYSHRKLEFGKDIIYCKDDEHGNCIYTGVQVKKIKLTTKCIDTIFRQITEAFGESFTDLRDGKRKDIDKFVVMTSNEFLEEAKDSLWASLKGAKLDKLVKCLDGDQLCELLDKHLPSAFWDEYDDFNKYFCAMKTEFEKIKDVSAIGQKEPLSLEKIYVSLRLIEPDKRRDETRYHERKLFFGKNIRQTDKERGLFKGVVFDIESSINNFYKLVIVGPPGAGKTTLLRHLALRSCKENLERKERIVVPILITLRELAQSGRDLRKYIDEVLKRHHFSKAKEYIERDLKSGKCMILLDGYDELPNVKMQKTIALRVQNFSEEFPKNQIILTSRTAGYHDELKNFTKLELMEFDDKQIYQFIENWFGETNPDKAKSMSDAIRNNEPIKLLARNPLMIAIIAIIYEEDRKLPEKRAALYSRCVEVLLSKWDIQKRLRNEYSLEKKEFILRKLAFYAHTNNKRILNEREVIKEIRRYLAQVQLSQKDAKPVLDEIWKRSYLLTQTSMTSYSFLHLSFQEYFTAMELKEQGDALFTIMKHLHKPWWEEVVLLYAGISKDATILIKKIREKMPGDIYCSNLILSGKVVANADFTEPSLREKIIKNLWSLYQTSEFYLLKVRAIKALALIKPDKIIDFLIKSLGHMTAITRAKAADALGEIGSEKAIDPLIRKLQTDKNRLVKLSVSEALRKIGSEKAVGPLINILTTDKNNYNRAEAADALAGIRSEKAVDPLIEVLATNKSSNVRNRAAYALGEIRSEKALDPLIRTLMTDKRNDVRMSVGIALGKIGGQKAVTSLTKLLTTYKKRFVRDSAAYALGKIGVEKAIDPLAKTLATDKENYVRLHVVFALGNIGNEVVIGPLIKVLTTDKNIDVRASAASVLGRVSSEKVIKPLIKVLATEKKDLVREFTAEALGNTRSKEAITPLIKTLTTDKSSNVRGSAAMALGIIGGKSAVEPLKKALKDNNAYHGVKVKDIAFISLERISRRIRVRGMGPS